MAGASRRVASSVTVPSASSTRVNAPALAEGAPSARELARHPHAMIRLSARGGSDVDQRLAEKGLRRRVRVRQPYFLAAAALATASDLVVSLPATAGRALAARWPVVILDPPFGAFTYAIGAT